MHEVYNQIENLTAYIVKKVEGNENLIGDDIFSIHILKFKKPGI